MATYLNSEQPHSSLKVRSSSLDTNLRKSSSSITLEESEWLRETFGIRLPVQLSSVAQFCLILCYPMDCSTPDLPVHHQHLELTQTHIHHVSDAIQPSHPLLSPSPLPSIFPSIRVFSNKSVLCIRWPKYWTFSFSIGPSKEHPGLIYSRMDWLDLFAVQGTLKSLLQQRHYFANEGPPSQGYGFSSGHVWM